jgi:hypothetical protein
MLSRMCNLRRLKPNSINGLAVETFLTHPFPIFKARGRSATDTAFRRNNDKSSLSKHRNCELG